MDTTGRMCARIHTHTNTHRDTHTQTHTQTHTHRHTHTHPLPGGIRGKEPTHQCRRRETQVRLLGWEDPLEEGMATHSNILAWRIPWTE